MSIITAREHAEQQHRKQERERAEAEKVAYTAETYGYEVLRADLEKRLASEERRILNGSLTADEYHTACGVVKGLRYALDGPDRFIKKARPLGDTDE